MDLDEKIYAHLVSVWREARKFLSIGGREGMLVLTDKHLSFIHKTESKKKWWTAVVSRQVMTLMKSKNAMITHDGYEIKNLVSDLENIKNIELAFDDILNIDFEEKTWGSVLNLEYAKNGKKEKFQYSIVQDWVKYPAKSPTKYMKVDWEPFVRFIKERQKITE